MNDQPPKHKLNPMLKLLLDLGPLVLFFVANARPGLFMPVLSPLLPAAVAAEQAGIFVATAVIMLAVIAALAVSWALTRHIAIMPVVTAIVVMVFGTLTLVLHDETFIKLKPTIIYTLFGGTLLGGWLFHKPLLAIVFDAMFHLTEEGWRKLTLRWAAFFLVMAVVNEIVWRTQTTDFWVSFKLFGFTPLTALFAAAQYRLLMRYATDQPNPEAEAEREEV
jgi:intracellular septation protein